MPDPDSPARARDEAAPDPAALAWLDTNLAVHDDAGSRETDLYVREVVLDAFVAGRNSALLILLDAGRSQLALTLDVLDRYRDGKGPFTSEDAARAGAVIRLATATGERAVDVSEAGVGLLREAAAEDGPVPVPVTEADRTRLEAAINATLAAYPEPPAEATVHDLVGRIAPGWVYGITEGRASPREPTRVQLLRYDPDSPL